MTDSYGKYLVRTAQKINKTKITKLKNENTRYIETIEELNKQCLELWQWLDLTLEVIPDRHPRYKDIKEVVEKYRVNEE